MSKVSPLTFHFVFVFYFSPSLFLKSPKLIFFYSKCFRSTSVFTGFFPDYYYLVHTPPSFLSEFPSFIKFLKKILFILFLEREEEKEKEREGNIKWMPLTHPQLGSWPTTQACALIGN